jgi:signal transduction histidine kinase
MSNTKGEGDDRRAAELPRLRELSDQLARNTEALAVTLGNMDQGILSLGGDGRTRFYNRRLLELLDLPESFMASQPTMEQIAHYQVEHGHYGDNFSLLDDATAELIRRWLGGEQPEFPPNYFRRTRVGRMLEVKSHYLPGGGLVRTFSDVTAYFDAQEELRAARDEAERASRAKSDFLSAMSHELRTPMNAILGFAQLLQTAQDPVLPVRQRNHVGEILRAGEHLLGLIDDVLDLARVEAGKQAVGIEAVDIGRLIADCVALMRPLADMRRIRLEAHAGPGGTSHVAADARRLRQVLLNLLSNAIKYTGEGGRVGVDCVRDGEHVRIGVSDTGPGLDSSQRERLFVAFDRLGAEAGPVPGAGIGLALSRRLIELMQGSIEVDSEPGRGSTFWVRLRHAADAEPLPDGAARPRPPGGVPPVVTSPPAADLDRATVLYIEDNPVNLALVEALLEREPRIRLLTAPLPELGLELARRERPQLILLDIQLPGVDGYEVLRRLRADESTRGIPVFALTASAMHGEVERGMAAGFDDYLTKPMNLPDLLARIRQVL